MATTKKTVLDRVEVIAGGAVQVRFAKLLFEDGQELSRQWHRASIAPGTDTDAAMAIVNAHLLSMGCAQVDAADIGNIKTHVQAAHTPEVIAAFKAASATALP